MWQHGPALITALTMLLLVGATLAVGRARGMYKIDAPHTTGHPDFERAFRAQANTLESTILFLPCLWLFSSYASPQWATILGAVWLVGRVWYLVGYMRAAAARSGGFLVSALAGMVLLGGALYGVVMAMMK